MPMVVRTLLACALFSATDAYSLTPGAIARPRAAVRPAIHTVEVPAARTALSMLPARVPSLRMEAEAVKETTARSLAKAVGWRFTAGVVTAITSMIFTGSLATAASIVGWDLCSKSVTMFLGERLWNKSDWGKDEGGDSVKRSVAKALAWRAFAATNTLFAAFVLTKGKAGAAGKIAGTDSIVKTILFYFYERFWAVVPWGKILPDSLPAPAEVPAEA